jgi:hypothetical protein
MFNKTILAAALASAALATFAMPQVASARPSYGHRARFEVLVLCHGRWENRGCYADRCDADRAAATFRHQGFRARVECD